MTSKERLDQMIKNETIPHALLFVGGESEKKALQFALDVISIKGRSFLKQGESKIHHDLHIYLPEGKTAMHPLKSLRDLSQEAYLSPFESKWKVFVVQDAERMLPTSANALLKTLEEPPSHTLIILVSKHPEKILQTIRSRCQTIEFPFALSYSTEILDLLAKKVSKEEFEKKVQEQMSQDISFQNAFFETIMLWYRDRELIERGDSAKKYLAFPDWVSFIQNSSPLPLEKVEKTLKTVRLAMERSIKLSHCLDYLFISLGI